MKKKLAAWALAFAVSSSVYATTLSEEYSVADFKLLQKGVNEHNKAAVLIFRELDSEGVLGNLVSKHKRNPKEYTELEQMLRDSRHTAAYYGAISYASLDSLYTDLYKYCGNLPTVKALLVACDEKPAKLTDVLSKSSFKSLFRAADSRSSATAITEKPSTAVRAAVLLGQTLEEPAHSRDREPFRAKIASTIRDGADFGMNYGRSITKSEAHMIWHTLEEFTKGCESIDVVYSTFMTPTAPGTYHEKLTRHKENIFTLASLAFGQNKKQDHAVTIPSIAQRLHQRSEDVVATIRKLQRKYELPFFGPKI